MDIKNLIPFGRKNIPVRREEYNPFSRLRQEMNRIFEDFDSDFWLEPFENKLRGFFNPRVDISETDKEIKITAELPGMDDKDIDVSLNKDSLTIKGEKKEEKEENSKDYHRSERSYGSFSRTISLPAEVDTDKIKADFRKGLLTVMLPKTAKAIREVKKIPIMTE